MEENGKQNSTADITDVNKNCMDTGVIPKLEMLVDDQPCCADEELIIHYLYKKMIDDPFSNLTIHKVDCFLYHPQRLSQMHLPSQAKEWYFLSPANKKYTEGDQSNSANNDGYWEPCGTDSLVHKDGKLIGYKKTLNYIEGKHEKDRNRTEWLMYEYRWDNTTSDDMQWVICKLFKLSNKLIAADEKEATKFAGPNNEVSCKDLTIQGPKKASNTVNDQRPSNDLSNDLHPLFDTDQVTTTPFSSKLLDDACKICSFEKPLACPWPQHDKGTGLPTSTTPHVRRNMFTPSAGPHKETNEVVRNTSPAHKHDSHPLPASDQGFMIPDSPNAKSQPQCDQETMFPAPLLQNDQRTMLPTSTGTHKANSDVVTDEVPSNTLNYDLHPLAASSQGSVIPGSFENILDCPPGICSFVTVADFWYHSMLPSHLQQRMIPPISGIHFVDIKDEKELIVEPSYGEWPYPTETNLPPFDGPFESLTEEELAFFNKPDSGYPQAYVSNKEANK